MYKIIYRVGTRKYVEYGFTKHILNRIMSLLYDDTAELYFIIPIIIIPSTIKRCFIKYRACVDKRME